MLTRPSRRRSATRPNAPDLPPDVVLSWPGKPPDLSAPVSLSGPPPPFHVVETVLPGPATAPEEGGPNRLFLGDNLPVAQALLHELGGRVDLIYLDPPFATGETFKVATQVGDPRCLASTADTVVQRRAYDDRWSGGLAGYLEMLAARLPLVRDLLSPTGSVYVHLGPEVASHVKVLMDEVLGPESFRNQVAWQRSNSHGHLSHKYATVHDVILFYGRTQRNHMDLLAERDPLSETAQAEYCLVRTPDGSVKRYRDGVPGRRFKVDDMTIPRVRPGFQFAWRGGRPSPNRCWAVDHDTLERMLAVGELYLRNPQRGTARCRVSWLDENRGIPPRDLWLDVGNTKAGRSYPTQKPVALLERIVRTSCPPGGLVVDLFCGSGTSLVAAEKLGRRWVGCDVEAAAVHATRKHLVQLPEFSRPFHVVVPGEASPPPTPADQGPPPFRVAVRPALLGVEVELRGAAAGWEDQVDEWAVDFNHDGRTFVNQWRSVKSRRHRALERTSMPHEYKTKGPHAIAVKVVDVHGRVRHVVTRWPPCAA
jgi:DNA modification methylase